MFHTTIWIFSELKVSFVTGNDHIHTSYSAGMAAVTSALGVMTTEAAGRAAVTSALGAIMTKAGMIDNLRYGRLMNQKGLLD